MTKFTTKGGAEVLINLADLEHALGLKDAIQKAAVKQGIKIGDIEIKDLSNFLNPETINSFLSVVMAVDSDREVRDALFQCAGKATYNGVRIVKSTFEDIEARKDYYEVMLAIAKENLLPFFERLFSQLKNQTATLLGANSQK